MIVYPNATSAYTNLATILRGASEIGSRNGMTREIHPIAYTINDYRNYFLNVSGRVINFPMVLAELIWIMTGSNADWIIKYNKQLENYADNRGGQLTFNAAYGKRARKAFNIDQIKDVIRNFQADLNTRQAGIIYRHPMYDSAGSHTKDRACNIASMFLVRDMKLDITQIVRSQDFIWGLPYNLIQFGYITQYIAEQVGIEVGQYHSMVNSLHVYEQHWPELGVIVTDHPNFPMSMPRIKDIDHDRVREMMVLMERMYDINAMNNLVAFFDTEDEKKSYKDSPFWHDALHVLHAYWLNKFGLPEDVANTLVACKNPGFVMLATKYFYRYYKSFRDDFHKSNSGGFAMLRQTNKTGVTHAL